jgi:hypothetical protein
MFGFGKRTVKREDVKPDENAKVIRGLIDQAGHIGRGHGMKCYGYAITFIYKNEFQSDQAEVRCYSELRLVGEKLADTAIKELAIHMMQKYGRKPRTDL